MFGGTRVDYISLMGLAGGIETFAGLFIVLGLFTQTVAFIAAIEIAVAYFMVHMPQGFAPLANSGEPAALFFAAFLALIAYGSGKWSLENKFGGK